MWLQYASYMTRNSQSGKRSHRVADVLSDHGSSLGRLLKRGSFLMQLQHLLSRQLDPALAARLGTESVLRTDSPVHPVEIVHRPPGPGRQANDEAADAVVDALSSAE